MNPQPTECIFTRAQVISEVLWHLTLGQRSNMARENEHRYISVSVTEELGNESTEIYTLEASASDEFTTPFSMEDFLGICKKLYSLLEMTAERSECWLQVGSSCYSIFSGSEGLHYSHRLLQEGTNVTERAFEFYLKVPRGETTMNVCNFQKCFEQELLRYKLTHPKVSLSLQFHIGDVVTNKTFHHLPRSNAAAVGDLIILSEPENFLPREDLPRSKVVGFQGGGLLNVTKTRDAAIATCIRVSCLLFDCSHNLASGPAQNSIIQIFMHGPGGLPLAAVDDNLVSEVVPLLRHVLNVECFGLQIKDVHHRATGAVVPDITFTASINIQRTTARREKLPTPFILVLHFVCLPSHQENLSRLSMNDILPATSKSFAHYLQDNATFLRNHISELVISILEMNWPESSKQRQREDTLKKAVPTVVDAITTIISNSTNENFRRNCLAYAGANSTQEVAEFLTNSLTQITEGNYHPGEDFDMSFDPGDDSISHIISPSDQVESQLASTSMDEEYLEEVGDVDLLEAFQQTYSQESPPFDCEGTDENAQPLDGRKEATGLEQVTEDLVKSLLEDDDLFEEQLLHSDWLIEEA
ncbi:uncharacterized protein [Apostichopus japonicus]|uniref:uncharacterized protein n=1 Tax=Stichopus japonicus TaxID=307972 RepID=UPI003AB86836